MDWLSLDTDIFDDDKIKRLIMEEGGDGFTIYCFVLTRIAKQLDIENDKNGYYDVDDPVAQIHWVFEPAKEHIKSILDTMAEIGLIDKNEWEKNNEVFVPRFLERTQTKTYLNKQKGGKKGANNRWSGKGTANDSDNGTANGKANGRPNGTPSGTANADKDKDKDKDEDKDIDKEEDIKQVKSYNDFSELDRKNKMGWVINKLPDGFFDEPWALVGKWLNDFKHKTVYLGIKSINSKNGWAKIKNDYEGNEAGYIFKVLQSKQEELEENDGKDEFAKLVEEAD